MPDIENGGLETTQNHIGFKHRLMSARFLTKSRFQLGMGCPSKLFYTRKPEYANQKLDDPFLLALAEGGFQVGELAKRYHPGGHDITSLDYEDAELETNRFLTQNDVI